MEIEHYEGVRLERKDLTYLDGKFTRAEIRNGHVSLLELKKYLSSSPVYWEPIAIDQLIEELREIQRVAYPLYTNASTTSVQVDMRDRNASHWTDAQGT